MRMQGMKNVERRRLSQVIRLNLFIIRKDCSIILQVIAFEIICMILEFIILYLHEIEDETNKIDFEKSSQKYYKRTTL